MEKTYEHLIYLMACALHGTPPEEALLENADLDRLLLLAKHHCVAAMTGMALENTAAFGAAPEETKKAWLEAKNKALRKAILQDAERSKILKALDDAGIWHMLLKGGILKDWYPKPGMREMADCDILIDPAKREETRQLFLDRGYRMMSDTGPVHDVYQKPPVYDFEMHHTLFSKGQDRMQGLFGDVKPRLLPVEGTACRFQFTNEDLYAFLMAHAYKHFSGSGTGLRTLADLYIVHGHLAPLLNWDRTREELEELGIGAYEESGVALAQKLFGTPHFPEDLTTGEQRLLDRYLSSGTYGTKQTAVRNRMERMAPEGADNVGTLKLRYCLSRIFLSRDACREYYTYVYDHPWLLPFFWIWRLFYKGITNGKGIRGEWSAVKSYAPKEKREKE